jgi:hypothetical protein
LTKLPFILANIKRISFVEAKLIFTGIMERHSKAIIAQLREALKKKVDFTRYFSTLEFDLKYMSF